jgi:hypothetical protein
LPKKENKALHPRTLPTFGTLKLARFRTNLKQIEQAEKVSHLTALTLGMSMRKGIQAMRTSLGLMNPRLSREGA